VPEGVDSAPEKTAGDEEDEREGYLGDYEKRTGAMLGAA
jgi:hypothetical protein